MPSVKFFLKEMHSEKPTPVFLTFSFNYFIVDQNGVKKPKFLKYFTGLKIHPKYWNAKENKAGYSDQIDHALPIYFDHLRLNDFRL
jgi:hypothetical protein